MSWYAHSASDKMISSKTEALHCQRCGASFAKQLHEQFVSAGRSRYINHARQAEGPALLCGGMMITTQQIQKWIADGELWRFYKTKEWISLKTSVLAAGHYECKICRQQGKITRYDIDEQGRKHLLSTVHHVNHVRSHPELAMSRAYRDPITNEVKDNLIPVCKACHNKLHPEKRKNNSKKNCYTNVERW